MSLIAIIILLVLILGPIFVAFACDDPAGLSLYMISLLIFIVIAFSTDQISNRELIPKENYSIETTPTRHYIYIRDDDKNLVKTLTVETVESYNLVLLSNFEIRREDRKNLFWSYTNGVYNIVKKDAKTKLEKQ